MSMTSICRLASALAVVAVLAGCASPNHRAPVDDRVRTGPTPAAPITSSQPVRLPPGAENAGKPGYYTVKPGDTLIRIGLETGQTWRDIATWNSVSNPNLIEVGQVLRVVPPVAEAGTAAAPVAAAKPIASSRIEARPLESGKPASAASGGAKPTPPAASSSAASAAAPASDARDTSKDVKDSKDADEPAWIWPANGAIIGQFEEGKRKGVAIAGKAGDPVVAAGDGRVVYAGSGLRGYGNLVIIKHTGDYLTAYAHNQTLLVKEDQVVRKGQKIAEMGATDADRVQLHFEIRKQGKPIDPIKQLPTR